MQWIRHIWKTGTATRVLPIFGLITMLFALGFLQLRWSAKVSDAERDRLEQNLQHSTGGFQSAFVQDLLGVCQTLQASQPRNPDVLADHLLDRYTVWRRVSRNAELIDGLYILPQTGGGAKVLLRLNPQTHTLEPTAWPDSLRSFANQAGLPPHTLPKGPKSWRWNEQLPGLIHPLYVLNPHGTSKLPQFFGYLFVVFNAHNFQRVYLPELGRRYFPLSNGFVFQLVQQNSAGERYVAYQSDKHSSAQIFMHPDAEIPLLDSSIPYRSGSATPYRSGQVSAPSATFPDPTSSRVVLSAAGSPEWQLVVRHRSGSVDTAVTSLRRRNLAVSMVVLLMLLISLVTILFATRRARRLARFQMEFASGVSHELRTPLAVIRSAAENLADGLVMEGSRVREYGGLIHKESRRLSEMVDHILDFANLHVGAPNYRLEPVSAEKIIEQVLADEHTHIQSAGIAVEVHVADNLPLLFTDAAALGQCLQNLLSNALKYGADGGKISLRATQSWEGNADRVLIAVEDFGAGIVPEELSHIYEPFYRSRVARDSQIHGTGLGLSLTRGIIESLGGNISVESSPGKGSRFTLHIPVVDELNPNPSR